ncbi:MAG: NUDIX domain-containing protein [bacterium]
MEPYAIFQFCPRCKAALDQKNSPNPRKITCTNCHLEYYLGPSAANAIVIKNAQGEILLVKRKDDPAKGLWDLPGGFVEFDETLEESIQREIKEELGLTLTNIKYLTSAADYYLFKAVRYHTIGAIYTATTTETNIPAHDDITATQFFAPTAIPWEQIAFPSITAILKLVI